MVDGLRNGNFEEYDKKGNLSGKLYKGGFLNGNCEFYF